jgi:hypothetical protein
MNVTGAKYRIDDQGYPFLDLMIDGIRTPISRYDLKSAIIDAGFVSLTGDWEDRVDGRQVFDRVEIPLEGEPAVTVTGALTNNPAVLELARRFISDLASDQFQPGKELL